MIGTASVSFDQAREQIEGMVQQGTAFTRVEDVIDAARFSDGHKAALWLLAWSLREPSLQRREARLMAGAFAADDQNRPAEPDSRRGERLGGVGTSLGVSVRRPNSRRPRRRA
jgi:hypothetical protein